MADIKSEIMQKLSETEKCHDVKIPFAIESGSRGWGFASPDSDYDCRFIYVHSKDWYLSVFDKKDIIEYAADAVFDVNGWDLKKALKHIMKSNAVMFEWLSSNEIYICDEYVAKQLDDLAQDFFNPVAVSYHYLSIARNKLAEVLPEDDVKLKKYFYILRPLANLNFIYQHNKMPYMEYDKTLSETDIENEILCIIQELKQIKTASSESFKVKPNEILTKYFQKEISLFEERLKGMSFTKDRGYDRIDAVFRDIIEAVRHDK